MSSDHFSMLHPHFTPDITLGHLVQAVVVIATVGGAVLGGYLSLRSDLELQRAEFRVALAGHEARLTVTERLIEERRTDDASFRPRCAPPWSASCRRSAISRPVSSANRTGNSSVTKEGVGGRNGPATESHHRASRAETSPRKHEGHEALNIRPGESREPIFRAASGG